MRTTIHVYIYICVRSRHSDACAYTCRPIHVQLGERIGSTPSTETRWRDYNNGEVERETETLENTACTQTITRASEYNCLPT